MEQQNEQLFGLTLDPQSKRFLGETAKWGRFLSVIGFILCGLIVVGGIYFATIVKNSNNVFDRYGGSTSQLQALGPAVAIIYILMAVLYFFPCLYLNRFANKMTTALAAEDQGSMTTAFENLKSMFKFFGVLTIIIISIYVVIFVLAIVSAG
jgi:hypothetical protein